MLVVEDEPVVRSLIVEVLDGSRLPGRRGGGWSVRIAVSLSPSIGSTCSSPMSACPGLNGRQLAEQARALRPGLKVLFITGYAENAALTSGFLLPGMEIVTKPFATETLAAKIRSML